MSTPNDYDISPERVEKKLQDVLSAIRNSANQKRINSLKYTYFCAVEKYNKTVASTPITAYNFNEHAK